METSLRGFCLEFVDEANWNAPRGCISLELLPLLQSVFGVCLEHFVDVAPTLGFLFVGNVLQGAEPANDPTVGTHVCEIFAGTIGIAELVVETPLRWVFLGLGAGAPGNVDCLCFLSNVGLLPSCILRLEGFVDVVSVLDLGGAVVSGCVVVSGGVGVSLAGSVCGSEPAG